MRTVAWVAILVCAGVGACSTAAPFEEPADDGHGCPEAVGAYDCECGRYRVELRDSGEFQFFSCASATWVCTVEGRWHASDRSLGRVGLRLRPNLPGVDWLSAETLMLGATLDHRLSELDFHWVEDDPNWPSFQPGGHVRFVRVFTPDPVTRRVNA
jgi:hypothetical protein